MNGLAQILGGLIAYGIGHITNAAIPVWKFPFVIFGTVTVIWGVIFLLFTPSDPMKATWLTEEEKAIALVRVAENETGINHHKWEWYQVKEAFTDPNFWLLNLTTIANNIVNVSSSILPLLSGSGPKTKSPGLLFLSCSRAPNPI